MSQRASTPPFFTLVFTLPVFYRKRESASYIVHEVRLVRERERRSDVTLVALKLARSFALFLAKNLHLNIGEEFCIFPCQKFAPLTRTPLLNGAAFPLSVAKYVALFETVRILCRFCQMA